MGDKEYYNEVFTPLWKARQLLLRVFNDSTLPDPADFSTTSNEENRRAFRDGGAENNNKLNSETVQRLRT